ncbi:MAG: methionine--tRNA ligase [Patescibacteria group bacterium]
MFKPFYLTTTLPYVNAVPHLGTALEFVQADIIARYQRLKGEEVFFNTGTDEHGLKIYREATKAGETPQAYTDRLAGRFQELKLALNLSYDRFIRTTEPSHVAAAQEFWKRCEAAGDIYKKEYETHYCVGCELAKTKSELNDAGRCPVHPDRDLEIIKEENYFFRFSKYQDKLLALYDQNPEFVVPAHRLKEVRTFVASGLEDFSISRLVSSQPWGIPVPGDETQTMYVWFDALVNYISTLGWPHFTEVSRGKPNDFEKFWPGSQVAGKDNLRQQAAMWQAMLMSANLPPSKQIVIHGFIISAGQKMSKSLGNVINPFDLVNEYGTDAVRYFLARHINPFEDSDVTLELFREVYNANLANGLGNLVSRILKMAELARVTLKDPNPRVTLASEISGALDHYEFNRALDFIWQKVGELDRRIQTTEPYKLIKTDPEKAKTEITSLVSELAQLAHWLTPLLPSTAEKITQALTAGKAIEPLFLRK